MVTIVPGMGKAPETAAMLLSLADNPYEVQTTTEFGGDHNVAFLVPDELHFRYLEAIGAEVGQEPAEAPKKRRGRPPKAATEPVPDQAEE